MLASSKNISKNKQQHSRSNSNVKKQKSEDKNNYQNKILKTQNSIKKNKSTYKQIDNTDTQELVNRLKRNRQNLCTCFDIYQLLFSNGVPIRCITHNNFASLYCQNQKKLLCVNCVYNSVHHKLHRVNPTKNSMKLITSDTESMIKKVNRTIQSLKQVQKIVAQNYQMIDETMNQIIKQMSLQFERLQITINQKFSQTQEAILNNFSQTKLINQTLLNQVSYLKRLHIQKQSILPKQKQQHCILFTHSMLTALIQGQKIEAISIRPINGDQLKKNIMRDIYKIRQFVQKISFKTSKI